MRTKATFAGASRSLEGDMIVSFKVPDSALEQIERLKDKELVLEVKKYSPKRSLSANAYFWVLCDAIAKELRTDKEAIYKLQLSRYGVFVDVEIREEALPMLESKFRYVTTLDEGYGGMTIARCYFGSSGYTTEEMSRLIDGTVQDAKDLGIDTWTPDEIARALSTWRKEDE